MLAQTKCSKNQKQSSEELQEKKSFFKLRSFVCWGVPKYSSSKPCCYRRRKYVETEAQKNDFLKYQNRRFLKMLELLKNWKEKVPDFPKNFWTLGTESSQQD